MDTRNGEIHTALAVSMMEGIDRQHMKEMELKRTRLQKKRGTVGRNDPCPCASGKKFKRCCLQTQWKGPETDESKIAKRVREGLE